MDRGKMPSAGRGAKSKAPQHPQDIFALGSKSTVVVSRDSEKRNIHKPSTSGVERKREATTFGSQPPNKRSRIGSPAEAVGGTSLEVDPVDLVPNVLQALDTHNSDKLLGLLTGSIRLLKSQRSKPDPILCMSLLYLVKIRPNMFAHDTVTQSLCTLLKREQGAAFKNKGNPLVFVLACNMLYAGHRDSTNWPDVFIKVYIEDALNERWWVDCAWCKCLVENIVTAFGTKHPPPSLKPTESTLGSGSPLMGSTEEDPDNSELEYSVFPRYSSSYEAVEALVLEAIKDQLQRRSAAPDAIGKGFLKLLSATCGFPEIRMIAASRLEAWLHSGKLWKCAQELLAYVCCNCDACGPTAARDHEVLAQLARMRLKTKQLQLAYQACLREMVSDNSALLRSVVTHTIYNELSNVRSPNNMAVLAALVHAQPQLVPAAMAETYLELCVRAEDYLRGLRALTREWARAARADALAAPALAALARALAAPPPLEPAAELRERAFASLADLFCLCCLLIAGLAKHHADYKPHLVSAQGAALGWLLEAAVSLYRPSRHDYLHALNKVMFLEPPDSYAKLDNWPPESERAITYRLCCEAPLRENTLLRLIFIGLAKEIPVNPAEVFELVEQVVRRACALPPDDNPLQVEKLDIADYIFQLCQFNPPDNITLPQGYTPPALAITSLYWRGWVLLVLAAAHNPQHFAPRAADTYPTLRALIEMCITNKPSIEWGAAGAGGGAAEAERSEAERAAILQLETHLAAASNAKLPVTEHTSRLLSQLTTLEPLGSARKPPQSIIEQLQSMNSQMRLGKLLCRQPALLLELVERHGTRRAMPWLHQLLRHDQLELSVLPVQCLCEFLCAGAGAGGGEAGKAGELCAHLRRTVADAPEGARAVLHYYLARLAHAHAPTRASAGRGLKLVLTQSSEENIEMDYNTEVSPEEWLDLLWELRHWEAVREEVVGRVRAACLVECVPRHVAAYVAFLAKYVARTPAKLHTDIVLDLSQVVMERTTVMNSVLGAGAVGGAVGGAVAAAEDGSAAAERLQLAQQHTLHALTQIFYTHLQKVRSGAAEEESTWSCGERVALLWPSGRRALLPLVLAHAHLKLLCYGPSIYDTDQEMYSWLESVWVGADAPTAQLAGATAVEGEEAVLLPDWLRLHLVRSARPALLEAGLRALPAHKLALFIQTFGMPVASMSALLRALDASPAGAVARLGVERAYMAQLLRVQRARGATGGNAFAAALRLHPHALPPDDPLFAETPLPLETEEAWDAEPAPLPVSAVPSLLATAFSGATTFKGDIDTAFTQLITQVTSEVSMCARGGGPGAYVSAVVSQLAAGAAGAAPGRASLAAPLLRALLPLKSPAVGEMASKLLSQWKCVSGPVAAALRALAQGDRALAKSDSDAAASAAALLPHNASREQLIAALEASTPSTLEAIGNKIIETQDPRLIVDVISHLLEKNQEGHYEVKVKLEEGTEAPVHVFSQRGLGCGLLLDWLSELQRETLGPQPQRQMRLMFRSGCARWRPLVVTLLAHRASWRTLHTCLSALLHPDGEWAATSVLNFAETMIGSPRVWQGRDKATPKHYVHEDTLRLDHQQLNVLVRYVVQESEEAEKAGGIEAMRRRIEARLPLILRCCSTSHALLACALAASKGHPMLLLLLYMKVPRVLQLLRECSERAPRQAPLVAPAALRDAAALSTSAADKASHTLLTALAAHHPHHPHGKDHSQKLWRMEAEARGVSGRGVCAGRRALPLLHALVRGARAHSQHALHHLLALLEVLHDDDLFRPPLSEEVHGILDCFLEMVRSGGSSGSGVTQRVAALVRRYAAARPQRAAALLLAHRETLQAVPALSSLSSETAPSASATPPPHALHALQRRVDTPDNLQWYIQELDTWGSRRGGAWGGAAQAAAIVRAVAPLAAHTHAPLRTAALGLLVKLLPAVHDVTPGYRAVLECLESSRAEVAQAALDKLPELVLGMQEAAARLLMRTFELGVRSRLPVEPALARTVAAINLHRGC
ncbi:integrator complex subunit 1 isoform X2 [Manduca sexta]|uniref:Integrator complex subunit 1 n=1 Tax=Manduca sexta TaxID=7130 RepID=A0A921YMG4_MANSE|nr:integrator complex subunit 1 isoform X2 [Manduca sexta]KAG6442018.1 hypothetical protein O3G_MSEX002164 [Manduca sexta]